MRYVMVLNDGETYTDLHGCAIVAIPDTIRTEEEEEFIESALSFDATDFVVHRFHRNS